MYVRGDSSDYDSWQKLGATGWGWKDVLPYFLKMENYQGYVDYEIFEIHILIDHHFFLNWLIILNESTHPKDSNKKGKHYVMNSFCVIPSIILLSLTLIHEQSICVLGLHKEEFKKPKLHDIVSYNSRILLWSYCFPDLNFSILRITMLEDRITLLIFLLH